MKRLLEREGFSRVVSRPFMWAPVGVLPYFGYQVPLDRAHAIDEALRKLRLAGFSFVNHIVFVTKAQSLPAP